MRDGEFPLAFYKTNYRAEGPDINKKR